MKNQWKLLRLCLQAAPWRLVIQAGERIFSYSYGAFYGLLFFRHFLNGLQRGERAESVLGFFALFMAYGLAAAVLKAVVHELYLPQSEEKIRLHLQRKLYQTAVEAKISCFEQPAFYDTYTRAALAAGDKGMELIKNLAEGTAMLAALLMNLAFALWVEPGILPVFALPAAAAFILQAIRGRKEGAREEARTLPRRQADYAKRVVYLRDYAPELRATRAFSLLRTKFEQACRLWKTVEKTRGKQVAAFRFLGDFAMQVWMYAALLGYIAWRYMAFSAFSLGDVSALSGAAVNLVWAAEELADYFACIKAIGPYAESLEGFLKRAEKETGGEKMPAFEKELAFEHVSFAYDGGKEGVRDVTFRLCRGETLALVGANGAGKTTLIKLLLRVYDPDSGRITLDGRDIREFDLSAYRRLFACAFQDGTLFAATAGENVLMDAVSTADEEKIRRGLSLTEGIQGEDVLTREFDEAGIVPSGGQAQRLMIGRVLASDAPVMVLDEPSAALDPAGEAACFQRLDAEKRTKVFISHRLSSVKQANCVIVMADGRIAERGTHEELMAAGGIYSRMYTLQAARYMEGGDAIWA